MAAQTGAPVVTYRSCLAPHPFALGCIAPPLRAAVPTLPTGVPRSAYALPQSSLKADVPLSATSRRPAASRPSSPFALLDDAVLQPDVRSRSGPGCLRPCSNTQTPQTADVVTRIGPNAAFEQLVGAEVTRPGRARTGGCACAFALRRRSRWRPPARSAARPAHPPRSAARSLERCGLPPAAFR